MGKISFFPLAILGLPESLALALANWQRAQHSGSANVGASLGEDGAEGTFRKS